MRYLKIAIVKNNRIGMEQIIANEENPALINDMIAKEMADSWNSTNIVSCFDGKLKDKIASAKMKVKKIKDDTVAVITVIGKPNIRFSQTITNEIYDQIDAQFSDGWGEGFFGYINIMTADDGTIFCVE